MSVHHRGADVIVPARKWGRVLNLELSRSILPLVGIAKKDESKDRDGIFRRLELRIGSQLSRSTPQPFFNFVMIPWHVGLDYQSDIRVTGTCKINQFY